MNANFISRIAIAAASAAVCCPALAEQPARGPVRIGFSKDAPSFVQQAAERIYKAAGQNATVCALKGGGTVEYGAISPSEPPEKLAYSHIVAVGMPDDPLVRKSQRFLAKFTPSDDMTPKAAKWKMYAFGYGGFSGHVGYVESGANPFLHSAKITSVPFETEFIAITGTSEEGINAAVDAFLQDGLVNGVAAAPGAWKRDGESLLDRDPLEPGKLPATGYAPPDGWTLAGRYDCPCDVRLGVLEATRKKPVQAVLEKFTQNGALDSREGEGAGDFTLRTYLNGLDRHAYGNAALTLFFETESDARMAARRLESNKRILASQEGEQDGDASLRRVAVSQEGVKVVLSTLQ